MLETLDYTIHIGSTPTFLYFGLYLYSAYAAHYVYMIRMLTSISSTELQRTGSVRSSSAFSNQLLNAEAFLANNKYMSST